MNEEKYPTIDYPKIKCVYERKTDWINGKKRYLVQNKILEDNIWFFDKGVRAVDKLHGTNICVWIESGKIMAIDNRGNRIVPEPSINTTMSKDTARVVSGILYAIEKGWLKNLASGRHYGELIAPDINGNLHNVDRPLFVPFAYLLAKCHWKSWVSNKYPKTFEALSDWFRELPSLFSQRVVKENILAEGLVFWHPEGHVAKLRRDMYEWF